ncbi:MAG: zf-HC2 domain-containing protein [Gammaproteobacteria bacterium]|nr:zf-HC2 domain-containing protein [Gammaproteobacteria bacterium]MCZ6854249.1 zf-HC2 domain-containing protein [Gammaproteobacteria bacterium]
MLTCKEISQLASESLDRTLTLRERFTLKIHLFRCDMCSRYVRQLKFLRRACADADVEQLTDAAELTGEARARIRNRLRRA